MSGSAPAGLFSKVIALACYALALAGLAAFGCLLALLGLDRMPPRDPFPPPLPWVINLGWLFLFGLQHSGMARAGFKTAWTRLAPPRLERSLYAALSGLALLGLALTWQPLPGAPLWRGPAWLALVPALAGVGLAAVNLCFDHAGLFGLRQAWGRLTPERLLVVGPYRYVRHPLMAGTLVVLWAWPVMPPALALLAGGLSLYVAVGTALEERDLRRRYGAAYEDYRRRVPALLPWRRPAPAATYPAIHPGEREAGAPC